MIIRQAIRKYNSLKKFNSTKFFKKIFIIILVFIVIVELVKYFMQPKNTYSKNLNAFLQMIRKSEGTSDILGYYTYFGGSHFTDVSKHPAKYFDYTDLSGKQIKTSAAGAYQITKTTWDSLQLKLKLPDFSPASQDLAAIELIKQKGALQNIEDGQPITAIAKVASVWASLVGNNYNQPTNSVTKLVSWYQDAGGSLV